MFSRTFVDLAHIRFFSFIVPLHKYYADAYLTLLFTVTSHYTGRISLERIINLFTRIKRSFTQTYKILEASGIYLNAIYIFFRVYLIQI